MHKYFIPSKIYRKITARVPICCVDILIKKNKSFLLVKRNEGPAKDQWWFTGGRVFFNEKILQTVKRKLREELNIRSTRKIKFLNVSEHKFEKGRFNKPEYNIVHLFLVEVNEKDCAKIRPDHTMYGYEWFLKIKKTFNSHLKRNLRLVGFK